MVIKTFIIGMVLVGITVILTELHRYMVYKAEIEQEENNGMNIDRRKRYFGDILSEEQLTRTELPEIEDAIEEELALPVVSAENKTEGNLGKSLFL